MRGSALTWVARKEYEEVVKILLQGKSVNPDKADTTYSRTPLSWAAKSGQCSQWQSPSVIPSGHFQKLPYQYESKTMTDSIQVLPSYPPFSKLALHI